MKMESLIYIIKSKQMTVWRTLSDLCRCMNMKRLKTACLFRKPNLNATGLSYLTKLIWVTDTDTVLKYFPSTSKDKLKQENMKKDDPIIH